MSHTASTERPGNGDYQTVENLSQSTLVDHQADLSTNSPLPSQSSPKLNRLGDSSLVDRVGAHQYHPSVQSSSKWPRIWTWELAAASLSLVCMGCVGILLSAMDGERLDAWPLFISLNALISVFITLSRSAMLLITAEGLSQLKWNYFQDQRRRLFDLQLFDDASRGPYGALRLLIVLQRRSWLASVGALITVAALGMDPFAQQILQFPTMMLDAQEGTASIRSAYGYGQYWTIDGQGPRARSIAAILSGLFHDMEPLEVDYSCSTGNCTWDPFETLADSITPHCTNVSITEAVRQTCKYSVLAGIDIYTQYSIPYSNETKANCTARQTSVNRVAQSLGTPNTFFVADAAFTGSLANVTMMQASDCSGNAPRMYLCELAFCRKTLHSSVTSGVLQETLYRTDRLVYPDCGSNPNHWWNAEPAAYDSLCAGFSVAEVPKDPAGLALPKDITSLDTPTSTMWVNGTFSMNMRVCLEELLDSSKVMGREIAWMFWGLHDGNFTQTFEDIAASMTNRLLRQGSNRQWTQGTALTPSIVVQVNWGWFSLPAVLVLLSILFLGISIKISSRPGRCVWKSSMLATLFHQANGLEHDPGGYSTLEELEHIVKRTDIVLRTESSGKTSFCC